MDYLQKDRIINVQCKANQLNHLQDNIKQKRAKNPDKRGTVPSEQRSSPHVGGDDGNNL